MVGAAGVSVAKRPPSTSACTRPSPTTKSKGIVSELKILRLRSDEDASGAGIRCRPGMVQRIRRPILAQSSPFWAWSMLNAMFWRPPQLHARSQRLGAPSRDGPRDGYSYRERFSKRQQHHAGLQRLARAAQPRQHSARLQCLSRGRMYGHRRHHLIFLTRLFLFISGLPACERNLQPSHPDSDGIHQCSAAADSGAVYRPRDGSFARCVAM